MSYKIKLICLHYSLVPLCLLFWLPALSQPDFNELDQLLKQNQKALGNNFAALVWKDGKMVYQKQFEKETGDFNAKTQAPVGSCSQWLTAAVVMALVDEGKISLDDKVSKYIPIFEKYMKSYITIRNCLTNTTGIQDASGAMKLFQKSKYSSLEEEVDAFASKREIASNPGTEVYYSNVGPDIAGRVLEIVTKKPFDRLAQEKIFRPLKMRGTSFTDDNGGAVNPSGGAKSTANDYMNFLIMILNKGTFEGKRVLSEKSVEEMETMQFGQLPVKFMPKEASGWHQGLGVWMQEPGGKEKILGSLNLSGTWPFIDRCRNYAAILFLKNPQSDPKKEIYGNFKDAIDRQLVANCQ